MNINGASTSPCSSHVLLSNYYDRSIILRILGIFYILLNIFIQLHRKPWKIIMFIIFKNIQKKVIYGYF